MFNIHPGFAVGKNADKERLTGGKLGKDESRSRSRSTNSSMLEKYRMGSGKLGTERSSSVLDKYRGAGSREASREPENAASRYGASGPYSYAGERKEREEEAGSAKGPRATSTRTSREPSPEGAAKSSAPRMCSRSPSTGKSGNATSEFLSVSKYRLRSPLRSYAAKLPTHLHSLANLLVLIIK
jgi:hypothetical protein